MKKKKFYLIYLYQHPPCSQQILYANKGSKLSLMCQPAGLDAVSQIRFGGATGRPLMIIWPPVSCPTHLSHASPSLKGPSASLISWTGGGWAGLGRALGSFAEYHLASRWPHAPCLGRAAPGFCSTSDATFPWRMPHGCLSRRCRRGLF